MKTRQFYPLDGQDPVVSSARGELRGAHLHLTIWVNHRAVGTLIFGTVDDSAARFIQLLGLAESPT